MEFFNGICVGIGIWFSFWFLKREKNPISDWIRVTQCENCGRTKIHRDQLTAHPCPKCGDKVRIKTGRYNIKTKCWEVKERN